MVTIWDCSNYGNRLQAYALNTILETELSCESFNLVYGYHIPPVKEIKEFIKDILGGTRLTFRYLFPSPVNIIADRNISMILPVRAIASRNISAGFWPLSVRGNISTHQLVRNISGTSSSSMLNGISSVIDHCFFA